MTKKMLGTVFRSPMAKLFLIIAVMVLALYLIAHLERLLFGLFSEEAEKRGLDDYEFLQLSENQELAFTAWKGHLDCEALRDGNPYRARKDILVSSNGILALNDGETDAFYRSTEGGTVVLAQMEERFEWWRGIENDGEVHLKGWYTQGNDDVKYVNMAGTLDDDTLELEGRRGPRGCSYTAVKP